MEPPKTLLVVGATSDIGRAVALKYAQAGWTVALAGRNPDELKRVADDLAVRTNAHPSVYRCDILHDDDIRSLVEDAPFPDTVVCLVGELSNFKHETVDFGALATTIRTNFEGPALLVAAFAARFAERGRGVIVGVSSVAGDRGRGSNVAYGSAKAGFTAFLSGMRNLMTPLGPRIVTVKPGFVRTRMTAGMKLPPAITAEPEEVANAIFLAAEVKHRDVVYVRKAWRVIMLAIRLIPERVFKKLKL